MLPTGGFVAAFVAVRKSGYDASRPAPLVAFSRSTVPFEVAVVSEFGPSPKSLVPVQAHFAALELPEVVWRNLCGASHKEPELVGGRAETTHALHDARQHFCVAHCDRERIVQRVVIPVHL
jgi:hypothetical protein